MIKEVNGNTARLVLHTNAKTVTIDLQARLVGMQLASCYNSMCNLQHAALPHAALPHAARAAYNLPTVMSADEAGTRCQRWLGDTSLHVMYTVFVLQCAHAAVAMCARCKLRLHAVRPWCVRTS